MARLVPEGMATLEWRSERQFCGADYMDAWLDSPEKRIQQLNDLHAAIVSAGGNSPFEGISFGCVSENGGVHG